MYTAVAYKRRIHIHIHILTHTHVPHYSPIWNGELHLMYKWGKFADFIPFSPSLVSYNFILKKHSIFSLKKFAVVPLFSCIRDARQKI